MGLDFTIFSRRSGNVNVFGLPPLYFGYSDSKPSALKLWITSRTRSAQVNDTSAIFATGMPCADSSTIWARRQDTTDPVPLRIIRSSRLPSLSSISRTRTRIVTRTVWWPCLPERDPERLVTCNCPVLEPWTRANGAGATSRDHSGQP